MKGISIIIPCCNCADTLEEAVDSIYRQGLKGFEIVMADDGSTDGTRGVMERLSKEHPEIKLFFHDQNRGGGAARNTAVKNAGSELIFCLDSDNILGNGSLAPMIELLRTKGADAVAVGKSIKFNGRDLSSVAWVNRHYRAYKDRPIPLKSLFNGRWRSRQWNLDHACPLLEGNILFTKRAFETAGGYPEHHGFDTQGFAFRFMCNGLTAYVCKEAMYFHRVKHNKSYYIREAEAGRENVNWSLILNEFPYIWSERLKHILETTNLNDMERPLLDKIIRCRDKFAPDHKSLIAERSKQNG